MNWSENKINVKSSIKNFVIQNKMQAYFHVKFYQYFEKYKFYFKSLKIHLTAQKNYEREKISKV